MHLSSLCRSAYRPVILAGWLLAPNVWAQNPAATVTQETITVRSSLLPAPLEAAPASVSIVDGAQMRAQQAQVNLSESLGQVPGLLLQNRNNYAQDLQLSIRGHGARSTFGQRGIQIYVDGIPATMPDGQGQSNHIDLSSLERLEVLRGPYSTLYGNASGGVIQAFTERGEGSPELHSSFAAGSDGQKRLGLKASGEQRGIGYVVSASRFMTDGYRPQSAADKNLFNARLDTSSDSGSRWTLVANHVAIDSLDPGGVTPADWQANPRAVAQGPLDFNTRKYLKQTQVGLVHEHDLGSGQQLRLMVYAGQRHITAYQSTPIAAQKPATSAGGVIDLKREYGGLDTRWAGQWDGLRLVVGLATNTVSEDRKGFNNYLGTQVGVKGALRRNERNRLYNIDPYAQLSWQLAPRWTLDAGLRYSQVRFDSRDDYIAPGNGDDSGKAKYQRLLPMLSLQHQINEQTQAYASLASGFETPTFNEISYRPGGGAGLNFGLQAARSRSAEIGLRQRLQVAGINGQWSAAVFQTVTQDEIVAAENAGGRTTYHNANRTRRQGLELAASAWKSQQWRVDTALTLLDARLRDGFCDRSGKTCIPAGKRIAGTSSHQAYVALRWMPLTDWTLTLDWRHVGRLAANDSNSVYAPSYSTASLSAGYQRNVGAWTLNAFARLDNLTDKRYIGSVIVNESNGRFYEAAPGRQWLAGVSAAYRF